MNAPSLEVILVALLSVVAIFVLGALFFRKNGAAVSADVDRAKATAQAVEADLGAAAKEAAAAGQAAKKL